MKKLYTIIIMLFVITLQGQNKLLSSIRENYYGGSWHNSWGYNYEYDSNNNLITETSAEWVNGAWEIREKVTYTYNLSNKITGEVGQKWNSTTKILENSYKDIYTYINGNFSEQLSQVWDNSQWVDDSKFALTYNGNLLQSGDGYSWDGTQWVLDDRESYTYTNNQLTGDFGETRVGSQWVNDFRGVYGYTNNRITSFVNEEWSGGAWSQTENTIYQIDSNGNRTSETNVYDSSSTFRNDYAYDTASQLSSFAHPFKDKTGLDYLFEGNPHVNKILSETQYSYNSGNYNLSSRTTYNYNSAINLSVDQPEIVKSEITVSPNPVSSVLNINSSNASIDKVIVTDITGRTVLQDESTVINVEKLAAGLYIVEAYSGNEKFTAKFVKK